MNPKLSFEYELIDYYETYKNIQIYNDNDTLIAACDFVLGASCGTFEFFDYYIDDIIQINETYSIMIHQTANVNNLCGDYIINNKINITASKTLANQDVKRDFFNVRSITTIITCTSIIVIVIGCCACYWYNCCKKYEKKYIQDLDMVIKVIRLVVVDLMVYMLVQVLYQFQMIIIIIIIKEMNHIRVICGDEDRQHHKFPEYSNEHLQEHLQEQIHFEPKLPELIENENEEKSTKW